MLLAGLLLASVLLFGCLGNGVFAAPKIVYQCTPMKSLAQMETKVTIANTGNAPGAACINVELVDRNNLENSQIVCSGTLQPGTSVERTVTFGLTVFGGKQYEIQCEPQK